jgi:exopolysaccharide biosynthesis protein
MNGTRAQANNMHRFVTLRAPRTAVGTRADGGVVLVVVDGWRFADDRQSATPMNGGATIDELRSIMADLGVVNAINLDGGGSSVLVIDGAVVSHPSDKEGERAVGDAILLVPHAG